MVSSRRRWLGFAATLCALGLGAPAAMAAGEDVAAGGAATANNASAATEGWAYKLPKELMSPFCPGRTLKDCTSPQAENLRMWLIVQEASGRSREDVEAELFERYGDVLRPAPRAEGFGLAAYLFPVLAFLVGAVIVVVFLLRQTRGAAKPQTPSSASDPELERVIDRELAG